MNVSKNSVSCLKIKRESSPGESSQKKQTNKQAKKAPFGAGKTNTELTIGFHVYGINLLLADRRRLVLLWRGTMDSSRRRWTLKYMLY